MKAIITILLLICSNVVMTFAWYGNLKIKEMNPNKDWPLYLIIFCSWGLALFEYCFMIPANRVGSKITGGPFDLFQLKIIQEAISLIVFTLVATQVFNGESLHWNHIVAFIFVLLGVAFAFYK